MRLLSDEEKAVCLRLAGWAAHPAKNPCGELLLDGELDGEWIHPDVFGCFVFRGAYRRYVQSILDEKKARKELAKLLEPINKVYHPSLPLAEINDCLNAVGFIDLEPGIYCGSSGRIHEQVAPKTYLCMTWAQMESGNYEVVVYAS